MATQDLGTTEVFGTIPKLEFNPFQQRQLNFIFSLHDGGAVNLSGLKSNINIAFAGGSSVGVMQGQIYGLSDENLINLTSISVIPSNNVGQRVRVDVQSTDAKGTIEVHTLFDGWIFQAFADYSEQPNIPLTFLAYAGYNAALQAVPAVSADGDTPVAGLMEQLAKQAGYDFYNEKVTTVIDSPYLTGSVLDQIRALANMSGIEFLIEDNVLYIYPLGDSLDDLMATISPETGLVGYPTPSQNCIMFTSLYNRNLRMGRKVELKSSLEWATGTWIIIMVTHSLDANNPHGGEWFTSCYCQRQRI